MHLTADSGLSPEMVVMRVQIYRPLIALCQCYANRLLTLAAVSPRMLRSCRVGANGTNGTILKANVNLLPIRVLFEYQSFLNIVALHRFTPLVLVLFLLLSLTRENSL
jgi:hypothetical protein